MFNSLSEKQKDIVFIESNRVVVRACPGSGKTFAVTARLANKLLKWDKKHVGMATLSFTNTAWEEIEKNLVKFGDISIRYPHFLGTIDSFINHYIFLPFGHLVLGCHKRPVLVGEPHDKWHGHTVGEKWFDRTSFDINGNFVFTQKYPAPPLRLAGIIRSKKNVLLNSGYANQHDANYFALKILKTYPEIAKVLASRFPVLLIDEAQDTTEIQMAIIDELSKSGLKEIFIVGDPDQAIFEWNNANPELFTNKCNEWKLKQLNECRRSSQNICNFVYKLSTLSSPANAVSPDVSGIEVQPEIREYDNILNITNTFLEKCTSLGIPTTKENVSILCRTKRIVNEVSSVFNNISLIPDNDNSIWRDNFSWCGEICEGLYLIENGYYKIGHKMIERGCFEVLTKKRYSRDGLRLYIQKNGLVTWRKFIHHIVKKTPRASGRVSDWLSSSSSVFGVIFKIDNINEAVKRGKGALMIEDIFSKPTDCESLNLPIRVGTIHSAKGETFEATLVVLDSKANNTKYKTIIDRCTGESLLEEELRTVYVAMTRPKRFLMLGVPIGDGENWYNFLANK